MKIELRNGQIIWGGKIPLDGKYTLEKWTKKRSLPQNKYYWKIVVSMIAQETGYTPDEAHGKLGYKFLLVKDSKTPFVKSTTSLSTVEFEEYLENVKRWASSFLNLYIPNPNESNY